MSYKNVPSRRDPTLPNRFIYIAFQLPEHPLPGLLGDCIPLLLKMIFKDSLGRQSECRREGADLEEFCLRWSNWVESLLCCPAQLLP